MAGEGTLGHTVLPEAQFPGSSCLLPNDSTDSRTTKTHLMASLIDLNQLMASILDLEYKSNDLSLHVN